MASTSTNKQPLLVDRPFYKAVDTAIAGTLPGDVAIDPTQAVGALLVDCTQNDGAICEHIFTFAREVTQETYEEDPNKVSNPPVGKWGYLVNFYMCPSNTVFNPQAAFYVGTVVSGTMESDKMYLQNLPEIIAPVAAMGSIEREGGEVKPTQFRALYIPKGQCLWAAAVQQFMTDGSTDTAVQAPIACVQGGFY